MPDAHSTACNRPRPGPKYWDWRCLNCDQAISAHDPWWRRLYKLLRNGSPSTGSVMTAMPERLLLVADGQAFGEITPDQARQCADWLRKHFPHEALVEFFDGVADYGSRPTGGGA